MNEFPVLPDPANQRRADQKRVEMLYDEWKQIQDRVEKHVSDFWNWHRDERMALYELRGPVFALPPDDLEAFTESLQEDDYLDPALALTPAWAGLMQMNPEDTRKQIREYMGLLEKEERADQRRAERERQESLERFVDEDEAGY